MERAFALIDRGEYEVALQLFLSLLDGSGNDAMTLALIGSTLNNAGKPDSAIAHLKVALEIAPDLAVIWGTLGLVYCDARRFAAAERCFEESIRIKPTLSTLTMLGALLVETNPRRSRAMALLALGFDPEWEEAQRVLAVAEENLRRETDRP